MGSHQWVNYGYKLAEGYPKIDQKHDHIGNIIFKISITIDNASSVCVEVTDVNGRPYHQQKKVTMSKTLDFEFQRIIVDPIPTYKIWVLDDPISDVNGTRTDAQIIAYARGECPAGGYININLKDLVQNIK